MTRVVVWNLMNFSLGRINPAAKKGRTAQDLANEAASTQRLLYIQSIVAPPAPSPPADIFVVIEGYARTREVFQQGAMIAFNSNTARGFVQLLNAISTRTLNQNWRMVPPIALGNFGPSEAVGVFYNANTVTFTGPWTLGAVGNNFPVASNPATPGLVPLAQYFNANWYGVCTPAGAPFSPNAGQWQFTDGNAPVAFGGQDNRPPFLTRFREVGGARRNIYIYSVHTSPNTAIAAVQNIGQIQLPPGLLQTDVVMVAGDFNVDPFIDMNPYANLLANYSMMLSPVPAGGNAADPARHPFCMTELNPPATASLSYYAQDYPALEYLYLAIDNVLIRTGGGIAPPAGATITVANTVVGTPYGTPANPAPPDLTSPIPFNSRIMVTVAPYVGPIDPDGYGPPIPGPITGAFNTQYGIIRGTSDHLPLVLAF